MKGEDAQLNSSNGDGNCEEPGLSKSPSEGMGFSSGVMVSDGRIPIRKTYKLYIGGKFSRSESGRSLPVEDKEGRVVAQLSRASRKDFRQSVVAARSALRGWGERPAHNRGQILYRVSEMLEGRRDQFVDELVRSGQRRKEATSQVEQAIDCFVYYAGWSDKYQQVFGSTNPVSSSHFNFSVPESMGVIAGIHGTGCGFFDLASLIASVIVGGNTLVVLPNVECAPMSMSFAEVLHSSDVPGGVVNILTGDEGELSPHFASHMDVNALVLLLAGANAFADSQIARLRSDAADNLKRVVLWKGEQCSRTEAESPYRILDVQEIKTTWHPIGI